MNYKIYSLNKNFLEIKGLGWIRCDRKDFGGIGTTFEKLIGLSNNNFEIPDYDGIEIKTKRAYSKSYISLFSSVPDGPRYHEVKYLKDKYGYPDKELKNYKVLNASVYGDRLNKVGLFYYFKLHIDRNDKKIYLKIYNYNKELIEDKTYWDFDTIQSKLERKMKYLALVKALSKKVDGIQYFKYYNMIIYKIKDFDTFLNLIESGIVRLTLKLSIFRDSNRLGMIHDHGSCFCILEENLKYLYNIVK